MLQIVRAAHAARFRPSPTFWRFGICNSIRRLSILFSTPFLVAILAGPMLGEWIGWRRWVAILVGFAGVLLVTRPGIGGVHWAAFYSVGKRGVLFALYRRRPAFCRGPTDRHHAVLFQSGRRGGDAAGAAFRLDDAGQSLADLPDGDVRRLRQLRALPPDRRPPAGAGLGRWRPSCIPSSSGRPASAISIFGDVPNSWTLAGAAVVVASGLYLLHRERVTGDGLTRPRVFDVFPKRVGPAKVPPRTAKATPRKPIQGQQCWTKPRPRLKPAKARPQRRYRRGYAARIVPFAGAAARSRAARLSTCSCRIWSRARAICRSDRKRSRPASPPR